MPSVTMNGQASAVWAALLLLLACSPATAVEEAPEPFPAEEAARTMLVPEGFRVELFAGEPEIRQPISFCLDHRGRLWVAEAYNYPFRDKPPQDRIVILEDTNGDGRADKRSVFFDKLGYVTGIEYGFGGVWIMSPPEMLFIPDSDGDDRPDGPPRVLLDGFGNTTSAHNIANGFTWGPDGWLYAGHGRTSPSDVGPPGTPAEDRIHHDGGVFRYHPTKHVFENFCDGSTNPWGVAFDDYGQAFISNCVDPHLFHAVQGARFEPWRGRPATQYAYERLPTIADHLHWKGTLRGDSQELMEAGGGHAHCGAMVYLGDNWPDEYRNTMFMGNVHGRRINNDSLRRRGSSYTAGHLADVMIARDPWFKAVTIQYGPHGEVYVSDWSDTGECHDYRNTNRETGRLFRITFGPCGGEKLDFAALSEEELLRMQLEKNEWRVTHARRVLQERRAAGSDMSAACASLKTMFHENPDVTRKLRALWALYVLGGADALFLEAQLGHPSEYIRAWAIRLLTEDKRLTEHQLNAFAQAARDDESPFVRLHLASALQRLPEAQRWPIVEELVLHAEDAEDAYLPLMVWYGLEPLVVSDPPRALGLLAEIQLPKLLGFIARRAASGKDAAGRLELLFAFLAEEHEVAVQEEVLSGMLTALRGRRDLQFSEAWREPHARLMQSSSSNVRQLANRLGLWLHDRASAAALRETVVDSAALLAVRRDSLQDLLDIQDAAISSVLVELLDDENLRTLALRGLARYDHPETAKAILARFTALSVAEKQEALATLASRASYAAALLEAVEEERIARSEFTAPLVRQLKQFNDAEIQRRITSLWGAVAKESRDTNELIKRFKRNLPPAALAAADFERGRQVYTKSCATCHQLFGEGGKIGPDLTGSNRTNLDYLLENILDPNALVPQNYQVTVFATLDGRVLTGMVLEENEEVIRLQTPSEVVLLPVDEVETRKQSQDSMMPAGILNELSEAEIRDLIGYLSGAAEPAGEARGE